MAETLATVSLPISLTPPASPTLPSPRVPKSPEQVIRIITPSSGTPDSSPLKPKEDVDPADPQNIQHRILQELIKLNANSRSNSTPRTPAYTASPYITRRNAFWTSTPTHTQDSDDSLTMLEGAEYDALGQQFTTLVIISTFTANLIIAFLTVAYNIISGRINIHSHPITLEVGAFFALTGMATHAGVIIISGRCAALALKHAKTLTVHAKLAHHEEKETQPDEGDTERNPRTLDHLAAPSVGTEQRFYNTATTTTTTQNHSRHNLSSEDPKSSSVPSLNSFRPFLHVCETLQLVGTTIFFVGVTVLIFLMFVNFQFPIMLTAGYLLLSCLLSWVVGFWEISASKQLVSAVVGVYNHSVKKMSGWASACGRRRSGGKGQEKKRDASHESDLEKGEAKP